MINVIGLGYIGLPTALMFASHGVEVVGTDCDKGLVETLEGGRTTFKESGLDELFSEAVGAGIAFTTDYPVCDTYIVSVPTPYDRPRSGSTRRPWCRRWNRVWRFARKPRTS